ncbi:hypothetical protein [Niveispirillum irakense]|uniref:hypothetical protein n=1 Tax=Niveispirillum irakense TaxID=34011 RepID=UPI00040A0F07|nr:hypothetical protein [Niveispirillum irakense]
MKIFSTEFPLEAKPSNAEIVSRVVAWLRGMRRSVVLSGDNEVDLDSDAPLLKSPNGEELRFRFLTLENGDQAIGFRHDIPDDDSRLWRTEMVLKRKHGDQDIVRLRTQCIALNSAAKIETPKKPYLIKSILQSNWGGDDILFKVSDAPFWANDTSKDLEIAEAIINGKSSSKLPVIYVSAAGNRAWDIKEDRIEDMAYQLGGISHVFIEPSRSFSYLLRDKTFGRNVYGGAVGIYLPNIGQSRRFYIGGYIRNQEELIESVINYAVFIKGQLPADGWDWAELQEQALRQQREHSKRKLKLKEMQSLYEEEIFHLKEQIAQLKDKAFTSTSADALNDDKLHIDSVLLNFAGPEIYPGEFIDRIRLASHLAMKHSEHEGLDARSIAVLGCISKINPTTGLNELLQDLERSTKDPNRMAGQLVSLLSRHGYREKDQNKHIRLESKTGFKGLQAITIATTPSDNRGIKNARKQIERTLGLTKLKE